MGCGREPSRELLRLLCSPQGKNSSVLHAHGRTSFLLACPKCLLCPSLVALTFAWLKHLPLYPVWGEPGRQAAVALLAQPGWAIGRSQGNKCPVLSRVLLLLPCSPPFPRQWSVQTSPCPDEGLQQGWERAARASTSLLGEQGDAEHARPLPRSLAGFALCPLTVSALCRSSQLQHSNRWPPL